LGYILAQCLTVFPSVFTLGLLSHKKGLRHF